MCLFEVLTESIIKKFGGRREVADFSIGFVYEFVGNLHSWHSHSTLQHYARHIIYFFSCWFSTNRVRYWFRLCWKEIRNWVCICMLNQWLVLVLNKNNLLFFSKKLAM